MPYIHKMFREITEQLRTPRFTVQTLLSFGSLILMALVFAGSMLSWQLYTTQKTNALERQRIVALHTSTIVSSFIDEKREKLNWIYKFYARDPVAFSKALSALTQEEPAFIEVAFIDGSPETITNVSSTKEKNGYFVCSLKTSECYQEIAQGKEFLSGLRTIMGRPCILLAIPVTSENGKSNGVIIGTISLEALRKSLAAIEVSNGEKVYVLDGDGLLIAYPNVHLAEASIKSTRYPNTDEITNYSSITAFESDKGPDGPIIGTTTMIPDTKWRVVVEISEEVAYSQARKSLWHFVPFLILIIILTVVQTHWLANKISKPILELTHTARMLGQGELSHRIELRTGNELELLAKAFNAMASALEQTLTSLEQKAAHLKQAREAADESSRSKSEFLANIGHDLRTPLNAILGYAHILEQDTDTSPEQQREWSHIIKESAQHLSMLIDDIVDIFKIEVRRLSIFPSDVHLSSLLTGIHNISLRRAVEKNIDLVYQPSSQLPSLIEVDPKRLRQVLLNLLDNAMMFTPKGTIYFRVSFKKQSPSTGVLRFEVEDTGVGIPPDKLEAIFEPFGYGHQYLAQQGAGLELAICQKLVQLMGSEGVKVESVLGKGSIFWFDLPVTIIAEEGNAFVEQPKKITPYSGDKKKILVVDDKPHSRAILLKILASLGFDMIEAVDGIEGVILALEQEPDLIFMDIVMPRLDGVEAIRAIRLAGSNTPIITLSGSALEQVRERSRLAGSDDFLPKPFNPADLHALLEKHLKIKIIWDYAADREHTKEVVPLTKIPPRSTLATLQRMAIIGDIRAIINSSEELLEGGYPEFAQKLRGLAYQLKDKEVLELVEECLEHTGIEGILESTTPENRSGLARAAVAQGCLVLRNIENQGSVD